ncbi:MAG: presqualene diphosphate synthase HpnD [Minwuia sp.]|nr:presqualene diphosphate synthase HpnD [Minwuia sp.]
MTTTEAAERHVRDVVNRSGTSFARGMNALPPAEQRAMYAIYAFCREIDDIADEPGEEHAKRDGLAAWEAEIEALHAGNPTRPTAIALAPALEGYDLPKAEFHELIAGMRMDVDLDFGSAGPMDHAGLHLYCRRVAGAVGLLTVPVFGEPRATQFALALGDALQLTNILRDIGEDAAAGRLYLPADHLARHGVTVTTAAETVRQPGVSKVCDELLREAETRFADARTQAAQHDRRKLRPALLMALIYRTYLDRLRRRGFADPTLRLRLSPLTKAGLALRARTI